MSYLVDECHNFIGEGGERGGETYYSYSAQSTEEKSDSPSFLGSSKITGIPKELIDEYTLGDFVCDGCVYFEMRPGMYGLPQAGIL